MNPMKSMATMLLSTIAVAGLVLVGSQVSAQETGIQALTHPAAPSAQSKTPAAHVRVADLFGESDEERAARLQHEQSQDTSISYARQRLQDMESTVRRLTGQIEQLDHRIVELNDHIERMQKDMDYRLCKIAAQQMSAAGGDEAGLPCGAGETQANSAPSGLPPSISSAAPNPTAPRTGGEPLRLAPPPSVLGTLPSGKTVSQGGGAPPPSPNRGKFDAAMKLLARTQYDEARGAFRTFADSYPNDELAPQAVYWVGDIAYVQKDYSAAARAFAEEIKKYPESTRAPDSMLKLGQSLIAMGQKQEGCTALGALPTKYPNASKAVIAHTADARKTAGCKEPKTG
jgi:tol-pal system protein YbgF